MGGRNEYLLSNALYFFSIHFLTNLHTNSGSQVFLSPCYNKEIEAAKFKVVQ